MKQLLFLSIFMINGLYVSAQDKVFTRVGSVTFFSETLIETIEANHKKVACAVDLATGKIQVSILIKGFAFEKALMEEHFNENYMESTLFPKATFKGAIDDFDSTDFKLDDSFIATVTGEMSIHGVTVKRTFEVEFKNIEGDIMVRSNFIVKPADHDIKIPSVVTDNIAKELEVKLVARLERTKN